MVSAVESSEISEWYERCVEWLLRRSGLAVTREPRIGGKTPDLLVTQPGSPDVVIECLVKLADPAHQKELREEGVHVCGGDIKGCTVRFTVGYKRKPPSTGTWKCHTSSPYITQVA